MKYKTNDKVIINLDDQWKGSIGIVTQVIYDLSTMYPYRITITSTNNKSARVGNTYGFHELEISLLTPLHQVL